MLENFRIEPVGIDGVHRTWETIRPGLEVVQQYGDGWIPPDVYVALKQGAAQLYLGMLNDRYVGFFIISPVQSWDCLSVNIWAAYSEAGRKDILKAGVEAIKELARAGGAKRLIFSTPRKGWDYVAPELGFEPKMTIWNQEV